MNTMGCRNVCSDKAKKKIHRKAWQDLAAKIRNPEYSSCKKVKCM